MIRLIVALDRRQGIAKGGIQPWSIPNDEVYFSEKTKSYGATVLVGSTTYKTFKQPLASRTNVVLTHHDGFSGARVIHNLEAYLEDLRSDLWVIGGANVYQQILDLDKADELYITEIDADFGCNTFFPKFTNYKLISQLDWQEENGFWFRYCVYSRLAT